MSFHHHLEPNTPQSPKMSSSTFTGPYNLDYRSTIDGAWYTSGIFVNLNNLHVRLQGFQNIDDEVFKLSDFHNLNDIATFLARFRNVSVAVEDHECDKVIEGMTVCALLVGDDDESLRYFDAIVDDVRYREHTSEKCTCEYALHWQHGPEEGNVTQAKLEQIYLIMPGPIDPIVANFTKFVKGQLKGGSSEFTLIPKRPLFMSSLTSSNETISKSRRLQEFGTGGHSSDVGFFEGSERLGSQLRDEDEDMGGVKQTGCHHFILLENLEKGLCPMLMTWFIHEQTTVTAHAYVFQSLLAENYARGAILVDSQSNLKRIIKFISNPNHFVVSSSGRPWVIAEDVLRTESFNINVRDLQPKSENYNTTNELMVVRSGTEEYNRAKKLKDLYKEYRNHLNGLAKSLDMKEKKILHPSSAN